MVLLNNLAKAVVVVLLIAVAFFLLVASCSRNAEKSDGSSFQSISGSSQEDASSGDVTGGSQAKKSAPKTDPKENNPITDEELEKLDEQLKIIADCAMPTTENGESADDMRFRLATELFNAAISRSTSKPATGDGAKVKDLRYEDDRIKWTYANAGDYDEDGEVTVADIAMVSAYLGADIDDGIGDDALEAWIDGNDDGEVTTADISVIAQNFLNRVDGYKLYRKMELDAKPIFVMNVALTDALDTHPKTFEIFDGYTPEQHWKYWPFLFASVVPVDERGKYGESSDYIAMNTITPTLTRTTMLTGVTGRVGSAEAGFNYNVITPETPAESFEWDFGGGCIPNIASGSQVRVTFAEPGTYVGTLTATSQYGTFTEKFPVVSKPVLKMERNSFWIDAYNLPYYNQNSSTDDVRMDIYGLDFDKRTYEMAEMDLVFNGIDRTPGRCTDNTQLDISTYRFNSGGGGAFEPFNCNNQQHYIGLVTNLGSTTSGTSSYMFSTNLMQPCTFSQRKPDKMTLIIYDVAQIKQGNMTGTPESMQFDGWFDWKDYDSVFDASYSSLGRPIYLYTDLMSDNKVKVTYFEGIHGDCNGDNIVCINDLNSIQAMYNDRFGDGINDDYHYQVDNDGDGYIGIPDISTIAMVYLSCAPGFRLKRDGVVISEYAVQCPKPRENVLINLWPRIEYIDDGVPAGEHTYTLCAYDPETGAEGGIDSSTITVTGS